MRAWVSGFLAAGSAWMVLAGFNAQAGAQDSATETTATSGSRISISVVVRDADGEPIRDLRAGDFTVYDDNAPQELLGFRAAPADAAGRYVLTLRASRAERANEYHRVVVRVERPNLEVRSIRGYYAHGSLLGQ